MSEFKIQNSKFKIFLGIDGGQSHTEAIIADERGNVLARGIGGASNHAEQPGGRERLRNAIVESVGAALFKADLPAIERTDFFSAHCAMTGGADYKIEIIRSILKSENLIVAHDAPAALFGATAGKPGIVVIAGTGSIVFAVNERGDETRVGGLGFLFSDEGSGFWLGAQTIRLAIKEQDGLIEDSGLQKLVLEFYQKTQIRDLTTDFYNHKITRDQIAALAKPAHAAAAAGNLILREQIRIGAEILAASVESAAKRLNFKTNFLVAGFGGMFRGELMKQFFIEHLNEKAFGARFIEPRFDGAIGALLLAYRQAEVRLTESLLSNLEKSKTQ